MYVAAVIIAAGFVLFYCSYQIRLGAYVRTLCRNRAAGRVVALTFDDGPDPEMTPRERGVRATFFLVGAKAERHPELVRRIAAEGHDTGIHTWEHAAGFPMRSSWAMTADILRCRESLRQIAGVETHLFRPPFGVTNPMVARAVKRTEPLHRVERPLVRHASAPQPRSRGGAHSPPAGRRQGDPAARRPSRRGSAAKAGSRRPEAARLRHGDRMRTV